MGLLDKASVVIEFTLALKYEMLEKMHGQGHVQVCLGLVNLEIY